MHVQAICVYTLYIYVHECDRAFVFVCVIRYIPSRLSFIVGDFNDQGEKYLNCLLHYTASVQNSVKSALHNRVNCPFSLDLPYPIPAPPYQNGCNYHAHNDCVIHILKFQLNLRGTFLRALN